MAHVGFSGSSRSPGPSGSPGRYLTGLCVATLGLCAAGWLALAPAAFGYRGAGVARHPAAAHAMALHRAALADWATAAGLGAVSLVTLICWVVAWRRTLRADRILPPASRRRARREARAQWRREQGGGAGVRTPDPAQVLSELRALLTPLLAQLAANGPAANGPAANGPAANGPAANGRVPDGRAQGGRVPDGRVPEEQREYGLYPPAPTSYDLPAVPAARSGGSAAMPSGPVGDGLLMAGYGEEEAW